MLSRLPAARDPAEPATVEATARGRAPAHEDRLNVWNIPSTEAARFGEPALHPTLQDLVRQDRPLSWLIAGDALASPQPVEASLCDRITSELRSCPGREHDRIINAAWSGVTVSHVRSRLPELLAHHPDVLLLLCGPAECSGPVSQLPQLESDVAEIIKHCAEHSALPMLATCPLPFDAGRSSGTVSQLVLAEALRALAAEWDAALIDLRAAWEQYAIPPALPGSWYDDRGAHPSSIGLSQIAEQFADEVRKAQTRLPAPHAMTSGSAGVR